MNELIITDEVLGSGHHKVCSRMQLADGVVNRESESTVVWHNGASAMTVHGDHIRTYASEHSTRFGSRTPGSTLVQERIAALPIEIRWKVSI